ncbi:MULTISPECIES: DUF5926 family protein [unclassified Aeromicrobium]|jgi:hypothetical protein|uniref:DUF5926 family protein n=1 Tax=unclassified Aeromicrobium TaxID=2633570 RepID=UPI0007004509|nr:MULTISPECIES: DUF5926 family protein [unclassified Aeromicrobium]KQO36747.1 topoisomerase II [Aeromicrobium sp. Leaf245]KQP83691.1 topoisomerase II [Aeromicrobium sp. Leaf291]RYY50694.1 MAG: topoisomerase II [Actinomycetales bacterium]
MGKKSRRTKAPKPARMPFVARTFEGLPGEGDWIALREFVPAATATVTLNDGEQVRVCSLLPGSGAGIRRPDGEIWLGLQVLHNHGDVSRDLAGTIETARETEPGNPVPVRDPGVGDRLQQVVDPASSFDVEVHDGFDFWVEGTDAEGSDALAQANESVSPTERLTSVEAAYWVRMADKRYLRWVVTKNEDTVLDGFARLAAAGEETLGEGTKLIGMFRAHGLLVPVWEMDPAVVDDGAAALDAPLAALSERLDAAIADDAPLTSEQRNARSNLTSRQLTIR